MTSRDFCYWLQGFFELSGAEARGLNGDQVAAIKGHLALVFKHEIDPSAGPPEHQAELNAIHSAIKKVEEKVDSHVHAPHARPDLVMRC